MEIAISSLYVAAMCVNRILLSQYSNSSDTQSGEAVIAESFFLFSAKKYWSDEHHGYFLNICSALVLHALLLLIHVNLLKWFRSKGNNINFHWQNIVIIFIHNEQKNYYNIYQV